MKCRFCGAEMYKDDVDEKFKGCKDVYWICETCQTSCIEEIRYFQRYKERWHTENNDMPVDRVVKYRIDTSRDGGRK